MQGIARILLRFCVFLRGPERLQNDAAVIAWKHLHLISEEPVDTITPRKHKCEVVRQPPVGAVRS